MAKSRKRGTSRAHVGVIDTATPQSVLFSAANGSGRWATQMLKAAAAKGGTLSSAALRTLDTLRHEEWKFFDDVLIEEAKIRLVGVADLINAGLTKSVPNGLGKTIFGYETVTFMDEAEVSLDGTSKTPNDRQEFELHQSPLPITHKDFFLNLRTLVASRQQGEALDTTQVRTAGRVIAEKAEKMLFQGGPTFGGMTIYGYTNFPHRQTSDFDDSKDWADATKVGESYMDDVTTAITAMAAQRQYGPFMVYVPADAGVRIENDYLVTGQVSVGKTIRERIESVAQVAGVRIADQLPSGNVLFVQMTPDNIVWVQGEPLQNVQWDEGGGFTLNFKAWQIAVPLIRADAQNRCGIYHFANP